MQVLDGCRSDRSGLCASMVCTMGMLTDRQAASSLAAGARQLCRVALNSRQAVYVYRQMSNLGGGYPNKQVLDGCRSDRSGLCASMVCTMGMLTDRQAASSLAAGARQL
jgi:hypothetical protein